MVYENVSVYLSNMSCCGTCRDLTHLSTTHTLSDVVYHNIRVISYARTMYLSSLAWRSSRRLSERDPELMFTGSYVVDWSKPSSH